MKVTEQQLIVLLDIAKWSLRFTVNSSGYKREDINRIIDDIQNSMTDNVEATK